MERKMKPSKQSLPAENTATPETDPGRHALRCRPHTYPSVHGRQSETNFGNLATEAGWSPS